MLFYDGFSDHLGRGGLIWDIVPDIRPGFTDYYWICQYLAEPAGQTAAITWFNSEVRGFVAHNNDSKTCFAWDNKARLWAGSSSALLYIGRPKYYANDDYTRIGSINKYITCMAVDNNNKLWMGVAEPYNIGKAEGILCYSLGENSTSIDLECMYNISNSELPSNIIHTIVFDHNDIMWLGTDKGAVRFDGETWTTFNIDNSPLQNNNVNDIAVETNNTIWLGTNDGIAKYTGEIITTSVDEEDQTPEAIPLIKTYPNPFNPSTTIEFTLPESGFATVTIYSLAGQNIRELAADFMPAGRHTLSWDGKDANGINVSSGIYITRLQAGKHTATGRMVLVR
ncbi:MAG: T9SS type A sorting domain-containing protein [Candidatus Latescibacteria bacterium]|nr:T9SS type A sorting domain-containing protein [Candidatus Latescibacterota bacterium]